MWDLVLLGLIITLEPVPVAGFILLLSTTDGTKKGLAYIAGWVACLVATVVGTLAVTGGHPPRAHSLPGRGVSAATVLLGVILVTFAVIERRRLRAGPRAPKPPPKWASKVDNMSPWASAGLGVLLQPWPLVVAGAALVAEAISRRMHLSFPSCSSACCPRPASWLWRVTWSSPTPTPWPGSLPCVSG